MMEDSGASVLMEVEELETAVMRTHLALQQFIKERKREKEFDVDELPVGGVVSLSFSLLPEVRRQLKLIRDWLKKTKIIKVEDVMMEYPSILSVDDGGGGHDNGMYTSYHHHPQDPLDDGSGGGVGSSYYKGEDEDFDSSSSTGPDDDVDYQGSSSSRKRRRRRRMNRGDDKQRKIHHDNNGNGSRKKPYNVPDKDKEGGNDDGYPGFANWTTGDNLCLTTKNTPYIISGKYYRITGTDGLHVLTQCQMCTKAIKGMTTSTSNFITHLKRKHPDQAEDYEREMRTRGDGKGQRGKERWRTVIPDSNPQPQQYSSTSSSSTPFAPPPPQTGAATCSSSNINSSTINQESQPQSGGGGGNNVMNS